MLHCVYCWFGQLRHFLISLWWIVAVNVSLEFLPHLHLTNIAINKRSTALITEYQGCGHTHQVNSRFGTRFNFKVRKSIWIHFPIWLLQIVLLVAWLKQPILHNCGVLKKNTQKKNPSWILIPQGVCCSGSSGIHSAARCNLLNVSLGEAILLIYLIECFLTFLTGANYNKTCDTHCNLPCTVSLTQSTFSCRKDFLIASVAIMCWPPQPQGLLFQSHL